MKNIIFLFLIISCFISKNISGQKKDTLSGTIKVANSQKKITPTIAGKSGGKITAVALCSNPVLINDGSLEVINFSVAFIAKGNLYSHDFKGDKINDEVCGMLSTMKRGSKIYFKNIMVKIGTGDIIDAGMMKFQIDDITGR